MESEPRYPATDDAFRISASSAETYARCGVRYFLDREYAHRYATVPILRGTALSEAAAADNRRKRRDGQGLGLADLVDLSVDSYKQGLRAHWLTESKLEQEAGIDDTAAVARVYGRECSHNFAPEELLGVEERRELQIHDMTGIEFVAVGRPDLEVADGIVDWKTGQPWSDERARRSRQLTTYGLLFWATHGYAPRWLSIVSFSKRGSRWEWDPWRTRRTEADYANHIEFLRRVVRAVRAGIELPAPEAAWWCSQRWCPYWATVCRFGKGGWHGTSATATSAV